MHLCVQQCGNDWCDFSDEDDEAEIENYYRNKYAETQVSER